MSKSKGLWRKLCAFTRATSANVAMMFGLSLLPLAIAAGAGLDFAHAMMVRSQMMDALDAAALAVGAKPGISTADATTLAQSVFNANYKGTGSPTITPVINGQSVSVTASDTVATALLSLVGKPTIDVSTTSVVVWGQTKLWVSLVLDNTGSMTQTDSSGTSKISALKDASHQLLTKLQSAAATALPGDVQVAIIPFAKDVNVGLSNVNASWIDWSDWNTVVPGAAPANTVGPGSACPLTLGCITQPGSTTSTNTVPSSGTYSGYICPDAVGASSTGQNGHYYDGCYNSGPPQSTLTTVTTVASPMKDRFNCKTISNVNSGAESCPEANGFPKTNGSANTTVTTSTASGYTSSSSSSTLPAITNTVPNDGSQNCNTNGSGVKTCTWTRNTTYTSTVVTTAKTPTNYAHTWVINDHSVWRGCVMDRNQNDDADYTTPGNKFPAEQDDSCAVASAIPLTYNWDDLNAKIDAMVANGGTNQTIGLAHGMQFQATGDPYNAPAVPANTTRYIILLSDGLNTMDRWYGDGSNQSTSVDARMAVACTNAKTHGFVIYTLFVDLNGTQGNSTVLQNCATDSTKYYDLTTSSGIVTAFNQIAEQITNLRVAN